MRRKIHRDSSGPYLNNLGRIYRPNNPQRSSLNGYVGHTIDFVQMDDAAVQVMATDEIVNVSYDSIKGYEVAPGVFQDDVKIHQLRLKEKLMGLIQLIDEGKVDNELINALPRVYSEHKRKKGYFVSLGMAIDDDIPKIETEADYEQFAQRQLEYWMEKVRG